MRLKFNLLIWFYFSLSMVLGNKNYVRLSNSKVDTYIGSNKQLVDINFSMTQSDLLLFTSANACLWPGLISSNTTNSSTDAGQSLYQICQTQASFFNYNDSDTFKVNSSDYPFRFQSSSGLYGYGNEWAIDTFRIGNQTIKNMQMGILNQSTSVYGILGIGLPEDEFTNIINHKDKPSQTDGLIYSNFPFKLKQEGIIKKAMYSLNALPFGLSEFVFGGINFAKINGTLETIPLVNHSLVFNTDSIIVNDLIISNSSTLTVIDNNSYELSFPPALFNAIINLLNGTASTDYPGFFQTTMLSGTLYLSFQKSIIPIDFSQIIDNNGVISITESDTNNFIVLGRPFISSAFVVVDLEEEIICIGRGSINSKDEIHPVGSSKNATLEILSTGDASSNLFINWKIILPFVIFSLIF